jgi:hypothetical protein
VSFCGAYNLAEQCQIYGGSYGRGGLVGLGLFPFVYWPLAFGGGYNHVRSCPGSLYSSLTKNLQYYGSGIYGVSQRTGDENAD